MQVILTAVGPDNRGLADPIVHHVTTAGANIFEIQMYDHDSERLFAGAQSSVLSHIMQWLVSFGVITGLFAMIYPAC